MSPILGVLILVALAVSPIMSHHECRTNSECPSTHCCVLGSMRYSIPSCVPYRQKDEQCRGNNDTITANLTYPNDYRLEVENVYLVLCPCADGLSCERGICN